MYSQLQGRKVDIILSHSTLVVVKLRFNIYKYTLSFLAAHKRATFKLKIDFRNVLIQFFRFIFKHVTGRNLVKSLRKKIKCCEFKITVIIIWEHIDILVVKFGHIFKLLSLFLTLMILRCFEVQLTACFLVTITSLSEVKEKKDL